MDYVFHILVITGIYVILAVSLNLIAGYSGLISLAQAAFYGLGAYTSALLTTQYGFPTWGGLIAGMIVAALFSLLISLPSLRLHDDYFILATFAFQILLFNILNNWISLTRGPLGISDIPRPKLFGWITNSYIGFATISIVLATVATIIINRITSSPFGRVLRAIREDEIFAQAMGKSTLWFKVIAFAVSTALAGLAGGLYAHYITYIDPTSFTVLESILIISMVIIGGAGSKWGPVIGALILVLIPEALRFVGLPNSVAANMRQIFYGFILVIMIIFRPQGLLGEFSLNQRLKQ